VTPDDATPDGAEADAPESDGADVDTTDASASPAPASAPTPKRPSAPPFTKFIVSAVGIAVAAWIWLGSAWRWDVTARDLIEGRPPAALGSWVGRYVRLTGARVTASAPSTRPGSGAVLARCVGEDGTEILVKRRPGDEGFTGRVIYVKFDDDPPRLVVDATRGRWNGRAGIAVVVVLWGLAHAAANFHVWRKRRETFSRAA
jgi:hypothetical protein